jgi:hypothetical protein
LHADIANKEKLDALLRRCLTGKNNIIINTKIILEYEKN